MDDYMKCLCGYEYERDIGNEHLDKGDEPFILIQSKTIGADEYQIRFIENDGKKEQVSMFACPRCKTVKLKLKD